MNRSSEIKAGKFTFEGFLTYPVAIELKSADNHYLSGFFMISPGKQSITISLDSNRKVPVIDNSTMREYNGAYANAFKYSNGYRDKLNNKWRLLPQQYNNNVPDNIRLQDALDLKKAISLLGNGCRFNLWQEWLHAYF